MKKASQLAARLERYCQRWWFLPVMAFWAGADMFIAVVPTDGMLITSAAMLPRRWVRVALWFTIGSTIGAVAMTATIQHWGEPLVQSWFGDSMQNDSWTQARDLVQRYGALTLIAFAIGPVPQQPGVVICGLAGMPLTEVFGAVLVGRIAKYTALAYISTHAPKLLRKFGGAHAQKEAKEIEKELKP